MITIGGTILLGNLNFLIFFSKVFLFTIVFYFPKANSSSLLEAFDIRVLEHLVKNTSLEKVFEISSENNSEKENLLSFKDYDELDLSLNSHLALYWKSRYLDLSSQFLSCNSAASVSKMSANENQYKYKKPEEYNLKIIVNDIVPLKEDYQSYVKFYIDRRFVGESERLLSSQKKQLNIKVKSKKKILLNVEKYTLNPFKKKWERVVNLYQPKKKYLYIPEDRILVYHIIYDKAKENPEESHLKYQYIKYFEVE